MDEALRVREFWFGPMLKSRPGTKSSRSPSGVSASRATELNRRVELWFGGDATPPELRAQHDAAIRAEFSGLVERAASGTLAGWADSPRRRLSLIILLDQFPRNIYRGSARAFAFDTQALALTLSGMQSAADAALEVVERIFFYMPLQHAESGEVQDESVAAYRRVQAEAPAELQSFFASSLRSAEHHRSIIEQFGRFPHRNQALNRASTPEEERWLAKAGERFGQ